MGLVQKKKFNHIYVLTIIATFIFSKFSININKGGVFSLIIR